MPDALCKSMMIQMLQPIMAAVRNQKIIFIMGMTVSILRYGRKICTPRDSMQCVFTPAHTGGFR